MLSLDPFWLPEKIIFTVSRWRPLPPCIQKLKTLHFPQFWDKSLFFSETLRWVRDAGHPRGQAQHPDLAERRAEDVDGGGGVRALGRRRWERVRDNEKILYCKIKNTKLFGLNIISIDECYYFCHDSQPREKSLCAADECDIVFHFSSTNSNFPRKAFPSTAPI